MSEQILLLRFWDYLWFREKRFCLVNASEIAPIPIYMPDKSSLHVNYDGIENLFHTSRKSTPFQRRDPEDLLYG